MASREEIEAIYRSELGRNPDAGGLDNWMKLSADEARAGIAASQEAQARRGGGQAAQGSSGGGDDIDSIYQELLGRNADPSGRATFSGMDPNAVRDSIRNSPEFKSRGGAVADTGTSAFSTDVFYGMEGDHNVTRDEANRIINDVGAAGIVPDYQIDKWLEQSTDQPWKFANWVVDWMADTGEMLSENGSISDRVRADSWMSSQGIPEDQVHEYSQKFSDIAEQSRQNINTWKSGANYVRFIRAGGTLESEFHNTDAGDFILLPESQNVGDDYIDVSDDVDGVPDGYRYYLDQGNPGSGIIGWVGNLVENIGISEVDDAVKGIGDAVGYIPIVGHGGIGRLITGSENAQEGEQFWADTTGTNRSEVATTSDLTVKAIGYILSAKTGKPYFAMGVEAIVGVGYKTGGSGIERQSKDWSDIVQDVAWASQSGGGTWSMAIISGIRAKTQGGGTWTDAGWAVVRSLVSSGALSPIRQAAYSIIEAKARGGSWKGAAKAGLISGAGAKIGQKTGHAVYGDFAELAMLAIDKDISDEKKWEIYMQIVTSAAGYSSEVPGEVNTGTFTDLAHSLGDDIAGAPARLNDYVSNLLGSIDVDASAYGIDPKTGKFDLTSRLSEGRKTDGSLLKTKDGEQVYIYKAESGKGKEKNLAYTKKDGKYAYIDKSKIDI